MSRLFRVLSVAALAGTSTLAQAQQPTTTLSAQPGQVQPAQPGQGQPGRQGQVQPGQVQPGQRQPGQAGMHAQGISLSSFISHKLRRGNEAEVELGQMAVDKAKHDSVKEFARMMVQSHQQMIQKLDQFDQLRVPVLRLVQDRRPSERATTRLNSLAAKVQLTVRAVMFETQNQIRTARLAQTIDAQLLAIRSRPAQLLPVKAMRHPIKQGNRLVDKLPDKLELIRRAKVAWAQLPATCHRCWWH